MIVINLPYARRLKMVTRPGIDTDSVWMTSYYHICSPPSSSSFTHSICQESSYAFNGQNLIVAGLYNDILVNLGGCYSVITLNFTLNLLNTTTTLIVAIHQHV
jgi:hypothetical protein